MGNGAKRAINIYLTSSPSFVLTGLMILDKALKLWMSLFFHSKESLRLNKASLKVTASQQEWTKADLVVVTVIVIAVIIIIVNWSITWRKLSAT